MGASSPKYSPGPNRPTISSPSVGPLPGHLYGAGLDDVDEVARVALGEQLLTGQQGHLSWRPGIGRRPGGQLHNVVRQGHQALVVGGDDDGPPWGGEVAQQGQHAFDLDVVEVGRRLVRQQERGIEREGPGDRHPLRLST